MSRGLSQKNKNPAAPIFNRWKGFSFKKVCFLGTQPDYSLIARCFFSTIKAAKANTRMTAPTARKIPL